jgi:hypothetical protein
MKEDKSLMVANRNGEIVRFGDGEALPSFLLPGTPVRIGCENKYLASRHTGEPPSYFGGVIVPGDPRSPFNTTMDEFPSLKVLEAYLRGKS